MTCPHASLHALNVLNAAQTADAAAMQAFYEHLHGQTRLSHEPDLGLRLAGAPELARAALQHRDLGPRPPGQAVPATLEGGTIGSVFAQWLRMRDDADHAREKTALQAALDQLEQDVDLLESCSRQQARLALSLGWRHWQWASLPASLAQLLGLQMQDAAAQQLLLQRLHAIALALRPQAEPSTVQAASDACLALVEALGKHGPAPLWSALKAQAAVIAAPQAQALGLLWQSYEAGAGMLGQALLASSQVGEQDETFDGSDLMAELARAPGAIHHTRRWAQRDCEFAGASMRAGDAVLVLLTGAQPRLAFGHGRHQCPGENLALRIGSWALLEARTARATAAPLFAPPTLLGFEALPNARIPVFAPATASTATQQKP
ncbi:hypothetical protein WG899_00850 [Paucibacter sp. AS339]|uniref:hypothetical protein n=1 Tax=Paucibacter hankyongi TaxID=3133434 RepID=UPI0030A7F365